MSTERKQEWFDNDEFWQDLYPFMFPEERFKATPARLEQALALAQPAGKAALDHCCGPGRWSLALAEAGFAVTGVDRTTYLLEKAKEKAEAKALAIEWVQADMRDFVRADAFDLALNMYTSFGYFDDKDEDLLVLDNLLTSLRPGGVCVIETLGKELLAKIFLPTTSTDLTDGGVLIQRHKIFDDWTRIRNEWILIRAGRSKHFHFHHTVYSGQELRERMARVGFVDVQIFGNLDGDPYDTDAERLVAVGRKAA